jgi:soluble lytic murein transglycosylase
MTHDDDAGPSNASPNPTFGAIVAARMPRSDFLGDHSRRRRADRGRSPWRAAPLIAKIPGRLLDVRTTCWPAPSSGIVPSDMRTARAVGAAATMALGIGLLGPVAPHASETAHHFVDADGVVHLTNVPADPRYRAGATGTITGRLRPRSLPQYAVEIQQIARQHGVSPGLITAVMRTESGFNRAAVSPKGAGGLMQLMPATAAALGVVDRFDPRENVRGGVRHLRYLLDRYQGSVALALAAYNAGEAVVDTYRGIPPYPETQEYVRRVLKEAGLSGAAGGTPQTIYRYRGPDETLTYSNVPPAPGRGKDRSR